jgi:chromate transporter
VTLAAVALAAAVALWAAPTAKLVEAVVQGQASVLLIFASGLKAGLLTFGGAYTAIPFVRNDAVGRGWMTDGQFLDGLALSVCCRHRSSSSPRSSAMWRGADRGGGHDGGCLSSGLCVLADFLRPAGGDRGEQTAARLSGRRRGWVVGLIGATTIDLAQVTAERVPSLTVGMSIFAAGLAFLYAWKNKLNVVVVILAAGLAGGWCFRTKAEPDRVSLRRAVSDPPC